MYSVFRESIQRQARYIFPKLIRKDKENRNREEGLDTQSLLAWILTILLLRFLLLRLLLGSSFFRRCLKHSRQCFICYPNTSNFVKNTPLRVVFSTLFSVFGYPDETLFLVFDILHVTSRYFCQSRREN